MTDKQDPVDAIVEDDLDPEPEVVEAEAPADQERDAEESTEDAAPEGELAPDPEPEEIHPADVHALAALALGIAPSIADPEIRTQVASSPGLRRELITLLPVADILTSLYQAQPAAAPISTPAPATPAGPERGQQVAAGRPSRTGAAIGSPPTRPILRPRAPGELSPTTLAIGALAIIAAVALLWALALLDRLSTKDDEIAALRGQVAELRGSGTASAVVLTPASDDAPDARGTVYVSAAEGGLLLDVSGLPELEEAEVYQIWFQSADSDEWVLGPAFGVNGQGESVQRLPGEAPGFARVAISREPAPGSPEPSGPFLLEGTLAAGAG